MEMQYLSVVTEDDFFLSKYPYNDGNDDDCNDDVNLLPFKRSPSRVVLLRSFNERFLDLFIIDAVKKPSPTMKKAALNGLSSICCVILCAIDGDADTGVDDDDGDGFNILT